MSELNRPSLYSRKSGVGKYFHKKTLSMGTLDKNLTIEVKEQIKNYLKKDSRTNCSIGRLQHSRDVSHLFDFKAPKHNLFSIDLPQSIDELKKVVHCEISDKSGIKCTKSSCLGQSISSESLMYNVKLTDFFEKISTKIPSGRKEAENLLKWFLFMKKKYENHPDFEVVVIKCSEELLKQISSECKDRGELMKQVIGFYQGQVGDAKVRFAQKLSDSKMENLERLNNVKEKFNEELEKLNKKINELVENIKEKNTRISDLAQESKSYKNAFIEIQKKLKDERYRRLSTSSLDYLKLNDDLGEAIQLRRKCRRTESVYDIGNIQLKYANSPEKYATIEDI